MGEDACREPERRLVGERYRLLVTPGRQQDRHRAKDLFARQPHPRVDLAHHRWSYEIAVPELLRARPTSQEPATIRLPLLEIFHDRPQPLFGDQRSDPGVGIQRVAEPPRGCEPDQALAEALQDGGLDDHSTGGRAFLPRAQESSTRHLLGGERKVRIGRHHGRILSAKFELHLRPPGGRLELDRLPDGV